jgi:hypothetical protein
VQQQEAANIANEETASVEMMRIMGLVTGGSVKIALKNQEWRNAGTR